MPPYDFTNETPPARAEGEARDATVCVTLRVVTPILGGAVKARTIDDVDVIRTPTVRSHLRIWWRALQRDPHRAADATALAESERRLFGGVEGDVPVKSALRVSVDVLLVGDVHREDIGWTADGAYALWPARGTRSEDPAPRRKAGTEFRLSLTCPTEHESEVKRALAAWIMFGGYGGRTRRGVGKIAPACEASLALMPTAPTPAAIEDRLGLTGVFGPPPDRVNDCPRLEGCGIALGNATANAEQAAWAALDWLNRFRQGAPNAAMGTHHPDHARVAGERNRPSISNWPEADKARHLWGRRSTHPPKHNADPAWPRASLGLPIQVQFQRTDRRRNRNAYDEPDNFELRWRSGDTLHDRLASPLITGCLPLANGQFAPFALWLSRAYPEQGTVVLYQRSREERGSGAPFDKVLGKGDTARFNPLAVGEDAPKGQRVRAAFFSWVESQHGVHEVQS